MPVAFESVGQDCKRHRQHCRPRKSNQNETYEKQVLVVEKQRGNEAHAAQNEAQRISNFAVGLGSEPRQHSRPRHRANCLNSKQDSHPVASRLIISGIGVGSAPTSVGNCAIGICPHIHKRRPTEKLHQTNSPERFGGFCQQLENIWRILFGLFLDAVVLIVQCGRKLLDFQYCIYDTTNQNRRANIERINHRIRHYAILGGVADANPRKQKREHKTHHAASVAEERLNGIRLGFLLLVHHIADEHFERLHCNIDARIKKHQRQQSKHHRRAHRKSKTSRIGQEAHYKHRNCRSHKETRNPAAKTVPRPVAKNSNYRLHDDAHQRRQNPEITQIVRVCAQRRKNAADIGTLERVGYLHSKKSETNVPERPEILVWYLCHNILV